VRTLDPGVWRDRAWERLTKSLVSGVEREAAERRWAEDVLHISDLVKVDAWCRSRGISVLFGKKTAGLYDPNSREIVIAVRAHPGRQLCYLLHECGHHLIGMKEHHDRFGEGYPKANDPVVSKTFLHRVSCLEEELEAWHRGWRLARRLNLMIQRDRFDEVKLECVKSYFKWAVRPKDWTGPSPE